MSVPDSGGYSGVGTVNVNGVESHIPEKRAPGETGPSGTASKLGTGSSNAEGVTAVVAGGVAGH